MVSSSKLVGCENLTAQLPHLPAADYLDAFTLNPRNQDISLLPNHVTLFIGSSKKVGIHDTRTRTAVDFCE